MDLTLYDADDHINQETSLFYAIYTVENKKICYSVLCTSRYIGAVPLCGAKTENVLRGVAQYENNLNIGITNKMWSEHRHFFKDKWQSLEIKITIFVRIYNLI